MNIFHNTSAILFVLFFFFLPNSTSAQTFSISNSSPCGTCVDVIVTNYTDIIANQGSISFDPNLLSVNNVSSNFYPPSTFGTMNTGAVTYLYFESTVAGETYPDGTVLFTVCFDVVGMGVSLIEFSNSPTFQEVADNTFQVLSGVTYNNSSIVTSDPNCILVVPPTDIFTGIYQGTIGVQSNSCVQPGEDVTFRASQFVQMDPGFCVELGGVFLAEID